MTSSLLAERSDENAALAAPRLDRPMPTLEFNSVELLQVAYIASERAVAALEINPAALTLDSLVAAVFAAAAIEAFTNDLADHVEVWRTAAGDWAFNATTPELIRAVQAMIAIDVARQPDQLAGKMRAAGRELTGDPKLPDGRDLQDLQRLIAVRDAIMHARAPRPAPRRGLPEVMADLARDGLTVPHEGANANVFFELESASLAVWAYCTARRIMLAMLDLVPPDVEAVRSLREVLRDAIKFPSGRCRGK
jgi:hypothetical protein